MCQARRTLRQDAVLDRRVFVVRVFSDPRWSGGWAHLVEVYGGDGRGGDRRVTRRVWQRFARPDGQLLLLPQRHHLLSDCGTHMRTHVITACKTNKTKQKTPKQTKLQHTHTGWEKSPLSVDADSCRNISKQSSSPLRYSVRLAPGRW